MNTPTTEYIAIDIAKDSLRVHTPTQQFTIANAPKGFAVLQKKLATFANPIVVCEASGGYERPLMRSMYKAGVAVARINPGRIRAYAQSEGIRAKTDPIDAKVIWRFAMEKKVRPTPPPEPNREQLAALMDRRAHLSEQLAREKNRLEKALKPIQRSIKRMLRSIEGEIALLDREIEKLIAADQQMSTQAIIIQSVKGVGKITAWSILAYLSEICHLKRNQVVALAGLAPFNKDTGKYQGKRCIQAGRAKVRRVLYMAVTSAAQHNPVIKPFVQRLLERGKPNKCAKVAAMRKLIIHIHSLLKNPSPSLAL